MAEASRRRAASSSSHDSDATSHRISPSAARHHGPTVREVRDEEEATIRRTRKRRKVDERSAPLRSRSPSPDPADSLASTIPNAERELNDRTGSPASTASIATSSRIKVEDDLDDTERVQEVGFESTEVNLGTKADLEAGKSESVGDAADHANRLDDEADDDYDRSVTPVKARPRGRPRRKKTFPPSKRTVDSGTSTPAVRATRANVTLPTGYIEGIKSTRIARTTKSESGTPAAEEYRGKGRWKQRVRMHGPLTRIESERRDIWLAELEAEKRKIEDESHPIICAVRQRLEDERKQRVAALRQYLQQLEAEHDQKLAEATELAWRQWADDQDTLRMDMYMENHDKLKALYAEEKDFSFIQEHPLFRDYKGIPSVPYYRRALAGKDKGRPLVFEPPPVNPALCGRPEGLDKVAIESDLDVIMGGPRARHNPPPSPASAGFVVRPPGGPRIWYAGPPPEARGTVSPRRQREKNDHGRPAQAARHSSYASPGRAEESAVFRPSALMQSFMQPYPTMPAPRLPPMQASQPYDLGPVHGPTQLERPFMPGYAANQGQPGPLGSLGAPFPYDKPDPSTGRNTGTVLPPVTAARAMLQNPRQMFDYGGSFAQPASGEPFLRRPNPPTFATSPFSWQQTGQRQ